MEERNFESVLKEIGKHGRYQLYVAVLVGLGAILPGFHTLGNVFLSGVPKFWCGENAFPWRPNSTDHLEVFPLRPKNDSEDCKDPCKGSCYGYNNNLNGNTNSSNIHCKDWVYDTSVYSFTVVSKWDLVCSSEWMVAMGQSTYMIGFLIGGSTMGYVSDRFGRKVSWLASATIVLFSAVGAAFQPSYWSFIAFRSVSGFAIAGIVTIGFVLAMEMTGSRGRTWGCILYQTCFAIGYMLLSGLAYLIRDFRYLQLTIGLLPLLFIPYIWILDESPRWLLTKKRQAEAITLLQKAAKMNGRKLPDSILSGENVIITHNSKENVDDTSASILTVLKYPRMRWRTLNVSFNWFVNSFVYYGLSLASANLAGGPYLNLFLSGLVELPSFVICFFTVDKFGRQKTLSIFLLTAAACCIIIPFTTQDTGLAAVILSLLGKLCISGSFSIIYTFTAELFPTVVRNLLVGVGCTFARAGGAVAPFMVLLGKYWQSLPMLCFGVVSLTAGLLTLTLPETMRQKLPDTLEEGEEFGRQQVRKWCFPCQKKKTPKVHSVDVTEKWGKC